MKKHFTATVYIAAKIGGEVKVLLHKHKKHGIWLGVGGHVEEGENPLEAAIREVKEETGHDVALIDTRKRKSVDTAMVSEVITPFIILEEKIPKTVKEDAHYHVDCIYFGRVKNPEKVSMKEEFRWFSDSGLRSVKLTKEVEFICTRALKMKI